MEPILIITYAATALGAGVVALALTPLVVRVARAGRFIDRPGTRKIHTTVIPRIGGLAVLLALLVVVMPQIYLRAPLSDAMKPQTTSATAGPSPPQVTSMELLALLGTSAFIFLVGFWDDARGLPARLKLLAQILAATAVCIAGIRFEQLKFERWDMAWEFPYLSWPLTVFWIVGVTNAVNLIDGLDGLAAGISAVTCAVIAAFAIYTGQIVMAILMLALLGSLLGFLVFNFNPAKIFLGDCGSMFLGYFLATASVMCATKSYTLVGLALPIVALGVPIVDTAFTMMRRALDRRSLLAADRGHIHHRIIDMGLKQRQAVLLIYGVTVLAAVGGLGLLLLRHNWFAIVVFVAAMIPLLLMFRVFGAVRLRETLAAMQRNRAIARESRDNQANFQEMQLRLRESKDFDQWWRVFRRACRALDLSSLVLTLRDAEGREQTLHWSTPADVPDGQAVRVTVPPHQADDGWTVAVEADIIIGASLESAGRRVAVLGRLLDEHKTPRPARDAVPE